MSEAYHRMLTPAMREGPGWRLYQADYRETLAIVADGGGADLIATSPPYCDCRSYGAAVSWTDADYASLGDAVFAALKPGGHALINVDAPVRDWAGDGRGTERGLHPWRLMIDWHDRIGFRAVDRIIYGRHGQPGLFRGRLRHDHEPVLWFQRPGAVGFVDQRALAERSPSQVRAGDTKGKGRGSSARGGKDATDNGYKASGWCVQNGMKLRGDLWWYGVVGDGATGAPDIEAQNHPARWPFKLAEDIVRCFCPPDGLVCDPFTGAGTTAAASIAHGRRFVGGDLLARQDDGKPWIDVAAHVLTERQRQQRLFAP